MAGSSTLQGEGKRRRGISNKQIRENLILYGSAGKLQNIFDHPFIPSLNKEGTEGWLIRDESLRILTTNSP